MHIWYTLDNLVPSHTSTHQNLAGQESGSKTTMGAFYNNVLTIMFDSYKNYVNEKKILFIKHYRISAIKLGTLQKSEGFSLCEFWKYKY